MRLSRATLGALSPAVRRPAYDPRQQGAGILHFGLGAFHRAHQAIYTDDAMSAGDPNWRIVGIAMRSTAVRDQLQPQDGLYTVAEMDGDGAKIRLVGAVQSVIVAPESPASVIAALASPNISVVSFTITEKGYRTHADGSLDDTDADVAQDLQQGCSPRSIYGFLARGLARRRAAGAGGLSLVCCDNLPNNGGRLEGLIDTFLRLTDAGLADWFRTQCACPSTMVDRIVPATTSADRDSIEALIDLRDEAVVMTEPYHQWILEDRFAGRRPQWESAGAVFVADVRPYETAKLRMLNGAHSALAYIGLLRGHEYVHQAIADAAIRPVVERLMLDEAASSLGNTAGLDAASYGGSLLARFANRALQHRLAQIAMDGSQKIPQRWLEAIAINRAAGKECPATFTALAAWMLHVRGDLGQVNDPLADQLAALWQDSGIEGIVKALVGDRGLFRNTWIASPADQADLSHKLRELTSVRARLS